MIEKKRLTIGVDFDGTIVEEGFPEIGAIKPDVVEFVTRAKKMGHLIIIWTSRSSKYLEDAVEFLNKNNIPYDYVNENPEDVYFIQGIQSRKLFCDFYLDDRAIHVDDIDKAFNKINKIVEAPRKAKMKYDITLMEDVEIDEDFEPFTFKQNEDVEILKQIGELFVIFSPRLVESTTVHRNLLIFE